MALNQLLYQSVFCDRFPVGQVTLPLLRIRSWIMLKLDILDLNDSN